MEEKSLKTTTVKGVGWSAVGNVSGFAVSFVVSIVLARLLSPDDYGLLGIIAIFTAICDTLVTGGMSTALIRKKDATEDDYNTAFIVNLSMSVLLYAGIFILAPSIASFFNRSELVPLTRVSSIGIIAGALALVQRTRLTKRIDFKTQTRITLIASIASGVIGIIMALIGFGVWALVAQSLALSTFSTVFLWYYNKWIPQLRFSSKSFHDLFGFGWKMMLSSLLETIWKELNQVVVGKFYTPASLGQYTRANQFANLFSTNLTSVIQRVTYPVLASIQDDNTRMVAAYRRIIKTTMFVSAIGMFFVGAVSEPLLFCLIGPKWHEASTYLPLICISGSLYPLHAINLNMLQVQGRSDLFLILEVIKKTISLAPLFIGAFIGILPMLYVTILTSIISFFLNSHFSGKFLGYNSWMQIRDISSSYVIAIVIAVSVFPIKFLLNSFWVILPTQIVLGAILFFVICKMMKIEEYEEVKGIVLPLLKRAQKK